MSVYEHMLKVASEYGGPSNHEGDEELCALVASFTGRPQSTKALLMFHDLRVIDRQVGYRPKSDAKHRVGKAGRMVKQILGDYIDDQDLEAISSQVKVQFLVDTDSWVFTEGTHFEDAFRGKFQKEAYFDTTEDCKSQNNSCMRYDYVGDDGYPAHPATAYDSGDFRVATLQGEDGLYLARTVICNLNNTRGPIYCVNIAAYKTLKERLAGLGVYDAGEGDWVGARMVDIPYEMDGYHYKILPYLDIYPSKLKYNGDKSALVITSGAGRVVSACSASGCSEYTPPICKVCSTETEQELCEVCVKENFVLCDHSGRYYPAKDCFLKWYTKGEFTFVRDESLHAYVDSPYWVVKDGQIFDRHLQPHLAPPTTTSSQDQTEVPAEILAIPRMPQWYTMGRSHQEFGPAVESGLELDHLRQRLTMTRSTS